MELNKKREKIDNTKIKKPGPDEGTYRSKAREARMGTPPLEERELTNDQKRFAMLIARNTPEDVAQKQCGFSDYQRRTYLELPKMKAEIAEWRETFAQEGTEKKRKMWDYLEEESILLLINRAKMGDIKNDEIFKYIINKSIMPPSDEEKKIKKTKQVIKPKLPAMPDAKTDGNIFEGLDDGDADGLNENEIEEKRGMIIEETSFKEESKQEK